MSCFSALAAVTYSKDDKQKSEIVLVATQSSNLDANCVVDISLHCGVTYTARNFTHYRFLCYIRDAEESFLKV